MYYHSAAIAILVFDLTDRKSFESVSFWIEELRSNVEGTITIIVCGNKSDLCEGRIVTFDEAYDFAASMGTVYVEASAKNGAGVELLFQTAVTSCLKRTRAQPVTLEMAPLEEGNGGGCC
jgi:GTPase SAR1 family protein